MSTLLLPSASGALAVLRTAVVWTALYVLAIWCAESFVVGAPAVTLFWPASGIAYAAVVGLGMRWVLILPVALLIAHATFAPVPPEFVPFSVMSNVLGALSGAVFLRVVRTFSPHRAAGVFGILGGAMAMAVVSAGVGTLGLVKAGMVPGADAAAAYMKWALSNLLGIACIAPALLLVLESRMRVQTDAPPTSAYAGATERWVWLMACVASYGFLYWVGSQASHYPLGMVAIPLALLVWSAFRFTRLWTATSTLVAVAVVTSLLGLGLAAYRPPTTTLDAVLLLGLLNLFAILPLMLMETIHVQRVGAIRSARLLAEATRIQQEELEALVAERTRQLDAANRRLEELSQTDALTGLRNRRYVSRQLPLDLAFYERDALQPHTPNQALYFALVDIDHFKRINDRLGHRAGDEVLQQFATLLGGLIRSSDYAVRWGGEEFLLVLRPMPSESVSVLGRRICALVAAHAFDVTGQPPLTLTCSVGFAERNPGDDAALPWEQTIELADAALYWVKQHGRNNWAALRPANGVPPALLVERIRDGTQAAIDDGIAIVSCGRADDTADQGDGEAVAEVV
ncbi:sensor domain-containing diguanylate cyclase [Luteimonas rhizosphaerae]|uniref:sensor domain-containing diguanylate cyclase n=1 Tax=Luteimonas sp. 4-12 TaxID=2027406 RepID=UPI001303FA52|nr:diguanylate cyclase [Luteimonas sp. 4-12]